ncbi:RNA polymerase sigma-I factor [Desulforudis sp. 1088]|uniref:RNA polymerase sigma-I factor n=1 Tax=unclassified Candidatus Desulforudis TaxID=2635950 RepID=UPI003475B561
MQSAQLQDLLSQAKSGDESAREQLIRRHRSYIAEVVADCCGRRLEPENDDELSIGLISFNEAIDSYNPSSGKDFRNYARIVIRNRLIDYFRKEARHRHLSLEGPCSAGLEVENVCIETAWQQYKEEELVREREAEISRFKQALQDFGLSLEELGRCSPKHCDTRETLTNVARLLARRQDLSAYVYRFRQLPFKDLSEALGVSRKVLRRGRPYIMALFIVMSRADFQHIRSLFALPFEASTLGTRPNSGKGDR